ncbi:S-locus glycoprotein domain [Dillenia turbinata]|uniref:Receptor-like serine/threonine-protein kinase n=1 Tax=Dillenia turbinata TaxID=194707 RepID=A0AAN8ZB49_9MAGN
MSSFFTILFTILCFILCSSSSSAQRTISSFSISNSPWKPTSNQTLLSPDSNFSAGFRPIPTSKNMFTFSIWYSNIPVDSVVWSANPNSPVSQSASLSISSSGILNLTDSSGENLWPNNTSNQSNTTKLLLGNEGNLTFGSWSSFSFPTNTFLPNQAMNGTKLRSNKGQFIFTNTNELVFNISNSYWKASNSFQMLGSDGIIQQSNGGSQIPADFGDNRMRRLTLDDDGNLKLYSYDSNSSIWNVVWLAVQERCTICGTCGANSICVSDSSDNTTCVCPPGYKKSSNNECEIKTPLSNSENFNFLRLDYVNFTGSSNSTDLKAENFSVCQAKCLQHPSCLGFQFKYDGSQFCTLQLDNLLYGYWSPGTEVAMFLKVVDSETDVSNFTGMTELLTTTCPVRISLPFPPEESNTTTRNIVIVTILFTLELVVGVLFFWAFLKKYIKYRDMARTLGMEFLPAGGPKRFTYRELKSATNNFSDLIGRGGFGDVYKGELSDGRVVAVKCLKNVVGGDADFWAEVTIIARMHHLNLVRLWGFCAEKGQRILVYEYVPSGSLDKYLFPKIRSGSDGAVEGGLSEMPVLDWGVRYRIAVGVARAIAYLHEECLEWVLHCDIKPENILLGDDFCPKISDFGLAKLRKKEDMVSMSRIRGTRGYMAPEWLKMDPITAKADVYSFGMVLLEMVSGTRNFEMQGSLMDSDDWYYPRYAFDKVFKEMKVEDILDRQIRHCYDNRAHFDTVNRMVKTAMWCVQDRPEARPPMGKVAKMLEGTVEITEPKKPTIFYLADE